MNTVKPRILVLGGGFGGLESAFYLRMRLGQSAAITLISDRDYFLFKPNTIYIPFGLDPDKLKIDLHKPTARKGIRFLQAHVHEIDPVTQTVSTSAGSERYDYLVVATGATMRPAEIPGMEDHAQSIWTPESMLQLRGALERVRETAPARAQKIAFVVPPNNKCAGPLYEMVFMVDTWLRRQGIRERVELTWATYEHSYIQAFGPRLHEVAREEFEKRQIRHHTEYEIEKIEQGGMHFRNGESLSHDVLITFPPYIAALPFPSLPGDDRGFIAADLASRQVKGFPNIYVAGDAGDFPIKQAFLAFLQSDAAAEHLASTVKGTLPEFGFEPTSMCVMEQFDKATFAQVPLKVNGGVSVMTDSALYKTGTSSLWRLGKQLLGAYLPWRFGNGEPFHAGLPWKGMELGLKVMSGVLAS